MSAIFLALSITALFFYISYSHGDNNMSSSYDKFDAQVKSGHFSPEAMKQFADNWFLAQQQDHQVIKAKETMCHWLAGNLLLIGVLGLVAVLFQACLIFSLRNNLRKP